MTANFYVYQRRGYSSIEVTTYFVEKAPASLWMREQGLQSTASISARGERIEGRGLHYGQ
jgi:hypothetical protein